MTPDPAPRIELAVTLRTIRSAWELFSSDPYKAEPATISFDVADLRKALGVPAKFVFAGKLEPIPLPDPEEDLNDG